MQSTAYHAVSVEALLLDNRMKQGNFSWLLLKKKKDPFKGRQLKEAQSGGKKSLH